MKKHYFGFKKASGTGRSRALKQQQLNIRRRLARKGVPEWELPFEGAAQQC